MRFGLHIAGFYPADLPGLARLHHRRADRRQDCDGHGAGLDGEGKLRHFRDRASTQEKFGAVGRFGDEIITKLG